MERPGAPVANVPLTILSLPLRVASRVVEGTVRVLTAPRRLNLEPLRFGGVRIAQGAGPGARAYIREPVFDPRLKVELSGGVSTVLYQQYLGRLTWSEFGEGFFLELGGGHVKHFEDEFFGIGLESQEGDRSDFRLEQTFAGGEIGWAKVPGLGIAAGVRYLDDNLLFRGEDENLRDVRDVFPPGSLVGLEGGQYVVPGLRVTASAGIDEPLHPTRGVAATFGFEHYDGVSDTDFQWNRWRAEVQGYVPLGSRWNHLAIRIGGERNDPPGESGIPFYYLPTLGGSRVLRGFRTFRFRDRDALYANFEYHWRLWENPDQSDQMFMEAVAFLDEGGVFQDVDEQADVLDALRSAYGGGFRLVLGPGAAIGEIGLDVAHSDEDTPWRPSPTTTSGPSWRPESSRTRQPRSTSSPSSSRAGMRSCATGSVGSRRWTPCASRTVRPPAVSGCPSPRRRSCASRASPEGLPSVPSSRVSGPHGCRSSHRVRSWTNAGIPSRPPATGLPPAPSSTRTSPPSCGWLMRARPPATGGRGARLLWTSTSAASPARRSRSRAFRLEP